MAILVDFSQVIIASAMAQMGNSRRGSSDFSEDMIRHICLNSIRSIRSKFKNDYGELIICCDGRSSWRYGVFPLYKASRKKDHATSSIDWKAIFETITTIKNELRENFPYKIIEVQGAEADDVIGWYCYENGTEGFACGEKILIVSGDKDYIQLQKFANVSQYDPIKKKMRHAAYPELVLREHIIRGDAGDGVPNMLSPDSALVDPSIRQTPITQKRLDQFMRAPDSTWSEGQVRGFRRNEMLVDLSKIPSEIKTAIADEFANYQVAPKGKIFNYLVAKKLKLLLECVSEFQ
jgi:hypothetical protein